MPSPSLAKLAARPRTVSLPPATPSIDTLTAFADDGLILFISDTSHKCSNCMLNPLAILERLERLTFLRPTSIEA